MSESFDLAGLVPDRVFDGGDLDCGSGLVLLIRDQMRTVPAGGVLEMRSREATVAGDLPPWCRMVGHDYLGVLPGEGCARYFVRKGEGVKAEEKALAEDLERAKAYEWRLRARYSGALKTTVYFRNFSLELGQPASFEERDKHPSAVEVLLSALAGDLCTGFAVRCSREGLEIDDVEITVKGRLGNVLAHLGLEEGDPSFRAIELKCFASTLADENRVREAWRASLAASPLASTLAKAVELKAALAIV